MVAGYMWFGFVIFGLWLMLILHCWLVAVWGYSFGVDACCGVGIIRRFFVFLGFGVPWWFCTLSFMS